MCEPIKFADDYFVSNHISDDVCLKKLKKKTGGRGHVAQEFQKIQKREHRRTVVVVSAWARLSYVATTSDA